MPWLTALTEVMPTILLYRVNVFILMFYRHIAIKQSKQFNEIPDKLIQTDVFRYTIMHGFVLVLSFMSLICYNKI